jgi:hypothetical protein
MSKSRNKLALLGDYIAYLAYRLAGWILLQIPLTWTFRIGQAVGLFGYLVLVGYRRLAVANLRIAFPEWSESARANCAREHFKNLAANLLSSSVLAQKRWTEVARYVDTSLFEKQASKINAAKSIVWVVNQEVLQLFDFAEKPLAFAILQKSQSLIVRHLGKAVFEQNRDFSEESNLCNTSLVSGKPDEHGSSTTTKRSEGLFKCFWRQSCESFGTFVGV